MLIRILTAVVGLPAVVFFLTSGGLLLRLALLIVASIGMLEFYKATGRDSAIKSVIGIGAGFVYFIALLGRDSLDIAAFLAVFIMVCCVVMVAWHRFVNVQDAALAAAGFFYVAFMLGFVFLVREEPGGLWLVWLVFISAWGADTCAYFTGKAFGKHKLSPTLSPSKTVEGALGGVFGAAGLAVLYVKAVSQFFAYDIGIPVISLVITVAVAAVLSIFGDLSASSIKRYHGVKDFGRIMPGHGGVLDRFDSVLFTAPVIYIALGYV